MVSVEAVSEGSLQKQSVVSLWSVAAGSTGRASVTHVNTIDLLAMLWCLLRLSVKAVYRNSLWSVCGQ